MKAVTLRKYLAAAVAIVLISTAVVFAVLSREPKCGNYKTGDAISAVKVTTEAGSLVPVARFAPGLDSKSIETSVVIMGEGKQISGAQSIQVDVVQYDTETGEAIAGTKFDGTDSQTQYVQEKSILCDVFGGVTEGSRIAVLIPSGPESRGSVFVFDIKKVFLAHAEGFPQPVFDGSLPAVYRDANGAPAVQFSGADAPTDLKSVVLIQGSGEKVDASKNQSLNVHYSGWVWASGTKFDSSWDNGEAIDFDLNRVIVGWKKGLDGVTVGSQVLLVLPPALAYKDEQMGEIPPNSTLVFVVDILGISKSDK